MPGDLDPSFDPSADNTVEAIAVQPDGRVIIAGEFTFVGGAARTHIARLKSDGTLDPTFNADVDNKVLAVVVQADGQIMIGGSFDTVGGLTRTRLARLNSDGTVDGTFTANANNTVTTLVVQADGKLLIGGIFTQLSGVARNRIGRLNVGGALDATFNPNANSYVYGIAQQADGMIVIGGPFTTVGGQSHSHIARLKEDGSVDSLFTTVANGDVESIAVEVNQKILIGGSFTMINGTARGRGARLNSDGSLDSQFNPNVGFRLSSIVVQTDGKLLIGGQFSSAGGASRVGIARFNTDGTLETAFDAHVGNSLSAVAIQADGKILIGGYFTSVNGSTRNYIARLANNSATQTLSVTSSSRVQWLRSGAAPETQAVSFEVSTNGGTAWNVLGAGVRVVGGWELTGLSLPAVGTIRAHARAACGSSNGSSGLVEQLTSYFLPSALAVTPSAGTNGSISPSVVQYANSGDSLSFTATPNSGYVVNQWLVGGSVVQTGGTTYTLSNITANKTVQVTFKAVTYTVTPSAGANGSISPNTVQTVASGGSAGFTSTPNSGYVVNQWLVDGSVVQTGGTTYTVSNVTANKTLQVTFKAVTYAVTPGAGANGTISPNTVQSVASGDSITFTATPNSGYMVNQWLVNGIQRYPLQKPNIYTVNDVTQNTTVQVTFKIAPTITTLPATEVTNTSATLHGRFNANGGNVAVDFHYRPIPYGAWSPSVAYLPPGPPIVTGTGDSLHFLAVTGLTPGTTYEFVAGGTPLSGYPTGGVLTFTTLIPVTVSAGGNGSVSTSAGPNISTGSSVTFTATPDLGYRVSQWIVNGTVVQTGGDTYTASNVTATTDVHVTFSKPGVDFMYDDRRGKYTFLLFDDSAGALIVITAAKARGGTIGKVKRLDCIFGPNSVQPNWPPGSSVSFFPNKSGLPAQLTSTYGGASQKIAFVWQKNLSSVKVASSMKGHREIAGSRPFPVGLDTMMDSSYLSNQTAAAAAQSGDLARWLAQICHAAGTWAYVASETLMIQRLSGREDQGIVLDPRWSGVVPMADLCAWIGGLDEAFNSAPESAEPLVGDQAALPAQGSLVDNLLGLFGFGKNYELKGSAQELEKKTESPPWYRNKVVELWEKYRDPVRNSLPASSVTPYLADIERGHIEIRWVGQQDANGTKSDIEEGDNVYFEVERFSGAHGLRVGELTCGIAVNTKANAFNSYEDPKRALEGKDFVVSTKSLTFKPGERGPKFGVVRVKKDREVDVNEFFDLNLVGVATLLGPSSATSLTPFPNGIRGRIGQGDNPNPDYVGTFDTSVTLRDSSGNDVSSRLSGSVRLRSYPENNQYGVVVTWFVHEDPRPHSVIYLFDGTLPTQFPGKIDLNSKMEEGAIVGKESKVKSGVFVPGSYPVFTYGYSGPLELETYWELLRGYVGSPISSGVLPTRIPSVLLEPQ